MTDGPVSRHWMSRRLRLHYLDWGNPNAPPLLLLHGGADHARNWDRVARELRGDWHVIALDLRGHGDSDWSADGVYPMRGYTDDLAALVAAIGPLAIIGHSLGGAIAIRHAALHPETVTRLVAIEGMGGAAGTTAGGAPRPIVAEWRAWANRRRKVMARAPRRFATIAEAEARMRAHNAHFPSALIRHLTAHALTGTEGDYRWKHDPLISVRTPDDGDESGLPAYWRAIACPTLLVVGADSWASNPAEDGRAAHLRDARVALIPDAGHWPHHDQHDRFIAEVRDFLGPPAMASSQ